jgi:hypothetical protein
VRPRHWLPLAVAAIVVALLLQPLSGAPSVPTSVPYASGAIGWDASFPQCGRGSAPPGGFGIVGLNQGRPFTTNPCLTKLWNWAAALPGASLYVNAAYSGSFARHLGPECEGTAPASIRGPTERRAWEIGCQEAAYNLSISPELPNAWWLDVEPANSWSRHRPALNRLAIMGLAHGLRRSGRPVGLYSYSPAWERITGEVGWSPPDASTNWLAPTSVTGAAAAAEECGRSGFSGLPVALVQWLGADAEGHHDADRAC